VCGFDLVEDEAVVDHHVMHSMDLLPANWLQPDNPGFTYYAYYIYANLVSLNHLRRYLSFTIHSTCMMVYVLEMWDEVFREKITRSHPEMVGNMSRVTLNFDLSKIPFLRF